MQVMLNKGTMQTHSDSVGSPHPRQQKALFFIPVVIAANTAIEDRYHRSKGDPVSRNANYTPGEPPFLPAEEEFVAQTRGSKHWPGCSSPRPRRPREERLLAAPHTHYTAPLLPPCHLLLVKALDSHSMASSRPAPLMADVLKI